MAATSGFAAFWTARTVSVLGSRFTTFAVPVYLYDRGASPVVIGLVLAATAAPVVLAPLAGVLADRVDPRRVMIVCDAGQMLAMGAVSVLLPSPGVLVALLAAASVLSTAFLPAGKSAVPRLVPRAWLGRANALLGVSGNVGIALGPALGALVYQLAGARAAFALDAASYGALALLLLLVPRMAPAGRAASRVWTDLHEGLAHVAADRVVRAVALGLMIAVGFAAMDNTALVFLTRDELGGDAASPGIALSVFGVGMIVVPLLLLRVFTRRAVSGPALTIAGLAVNGIGLTLAGIAPVLVLVVLAYGVAGVGNGLENIGVDTTLGEQVPGPLLGRVFGAVYASMAAADVVASSLAGPLAEATSARVVFVLAGVGTVIAGGLTLLLAHGRRGR